MTSESHLLAGSVELLNQLYLHTLDKTWVDTIWDGQFTENHDLPIQYEEKISGLDISSILERLRSICQKYANAENLEGTTISAQNRSIEDRTVALGIKSYWTSLTEQNISSKNLIAVLFYFISNGQSMSATISDRKIGLIASGFYLTLIGLPGSGAFKIFHPVLYGKALDAMKITEKMAILKTAKKKKNANKTSTAGRPRHDANEEDFDPFSQDGQSDPFGNEDEDEQEMFSEVEQKMLVHLVVEVLECLGLMLEQFNFKRSQESLELTVSTLVGMTRLEQTTGLPINILHNERLPRGISLTSIICVRCYEALSNLIRADHGDMKQSSLLILKALIPQVLLIPADAEETSKCLAVIKLNATRFIKHIVSRGDQTYISKCLLIFIQHASAKVPDKADYRREAAFALRYFLQILKPEDFKNGLKWLLSYANSSKTSNRLFAIDLLGKVLNSDNTLQDEEQDEQERNESDVCLGEESRAYLKQLQKFIFATVYHRSNDVAPTVRSQALKVLGDITSSESEDVKTLLQTVLNNKEKRSNTDWIACLAKEVQSVENDILDDEEPAAPNQQQRNSEADEEEDVAFDLDKCNPLPSAHEFIRDLRQKAVDLSVFVRRSALQALENMVVKSGNISQELVTVLADHCRDPSMAIRKQMINTLSELVITYNESLFMVDIWVQGVLPLVLDVEAKVGEKAAQSVWEVLIANFEEAKKAGTFLHRLPWKILESVEKLKMESYLSKACLQWSKEGKLNKTILNKIQSYIGTNENGPAWMLLGILSTYMPLPDPQFALRYFNSAISQTRSESMNMYMLLQVVKVCKSSLPHLTPQNRKELKESLLNSLRAFELPPEIIGTALDVVTIVSRLEMDNDRFNPVQYQSAIDSWAADILVNIERTLEATVLTEQSGVKDPTLLLRVIFTLGDLAQISPNRINNKLFLLLQSIVFFKEEKKENEEDEDNVPLFSQALACRFVPSNKLRALSVVTLGKMCIQNDAQAKKIIPAFGHILDTTSDFAIKNNIMFALSDMCIRFASMVDPLIGKITTCLRDKFLVVRRTTLIQLIRLLQEDYLKIRGNTNFFLRILQTLLDKSIEIRQLTKFYIEQRLLKTVPNIMFSCFVEAVFHFNNYQGHHHYNKLYHKLSERELKIFDLAGDDNTEKRRYLYRFMLDHMTDEERFKTSYKLVSNILNGVVNGEVVLAKAKHVLQDTLYCLSSKEIKLASLKEKAGGEEENLEGQVLEAARRAVITSSVKKTLIEIVIPTVLALKTKLEEDRSSILGDLFEYLKKVMEDFKAEVKDILAADPQVAKEIEYDIRKHDEKLQAEKEERERLMEAEEREEAENQDELAIAAPADVSISGPRSPIIGPREALVRDKIAQRRHSMIGGTPRSRMGNQVLKEAISNLQKRRLSQPAAVSLANINLSIALSSTEHTDNSGGLRDGSAQATAETQNSVAVADGEREPAVIGSRASGNKSGQNTPAKNGLLDTQADEASGEASSEKHQMDCESGPDPAANPVAVAPEDDEAQGDNANGKENEEPTAEGSVDNVRADERPSEVQPTDQAAEKSIRKSFRLPRRESVLAINTSHNASSAGATASDDQPKRSQKQSRKRTDASLSEEDRRSAKRPARESVQQTEIAPPPDPSEKQNAGQEFLQPMTRRRSNLSVQARRSDDERVGEPHEEPDQASEGRKKDDLNSSKRISGKGIPRQKCKTPSIKKHNMLRAVSTPQMNKTMMANNLTFNGTAFDISDITVLSPASSVGGSSNNSRTKSDRRDVSSFRFSNKKDAFEDLLKNTENGRTTRSSQSSGQTTRQSESQR